MGPAIGMCILLQKVKMYATEDDGGQATFSISRVMQTIVLWVSDLSCKGVRTPAMEGCWQEINSNIQAVMGNKDSLVRPENIIYQKILVTMTTGNNFVVILFVSIIVSTNLPYY